MATYSSSKLKISGTFNNTVKVDYEVRVTPSGTSTFGVKITNHDRDEFLKFTHGSATVEVRQPVGDGTFEAHTFGVPIWVGDFLYENTGGVNVTSNSNKFIGRVTAITTGTEGQSVKSFTIDNGGGTAGISNSVSWSGDREGSVSYVTQIKDSGTSCTSHDADDEKFGSGKAYMHGIEFRFNGSMNAAPPTSGSYHYFAFTGYPTKDFQADSIIKVQKGDKHHIVGWLERDEAFTKIEDIYTEVNNVNQPSEQEFLQYGIPILKKPVFNPRGDDIFVGVGPNEDNVYMGYPNIKQFGRDVGQEFIVENGILNVDMTVLPSMEEFVLPNNSNTGADADGLDVNILHSNQLIVGYVKGSNFLIKATRTTGVIETINMDGTIKGLYLNHETSNQVWVLLDSVDAYRVALVSIGDNTTAMAISENRVYRLQGTSSNDKMITPFDKEDVVMTDLIVNDNYIYVLASAPNYYDSESTVKDKCFGSLASREAYIWRSDSIASAPGSYVNNQAYHNLNCVDITPAFSSDEDDSNSQRDAYFIHFTHVDWESSIEGQGSGGGRYVENASYVGGGTEQYKFLRSPVPKGLSLYSNEANKESICVAIGYTNNSFLEGTDGFYTVYDTRTEEDKSGGDYEKETTEKCIIGPLIKQDSGDVIVGSHLEIFYDSETSVKSSNSSYAGVKRIMLDNSDATNGTPTKYTLGDSQNLTEWNIYGSGENLGTAINSVSTFISDTTREFPRALIYTTDLNVVFFDMVNDITAIQLKASEKSKRYFLNNTLVDRELFEPSQDTGWKLASQQFNYISSQSDNEFDWLACCPSTNFTIYNLVSPRVADGDTAWAKMDIKSAIDVEVTHLSSGEEDFNNLLPDSSDGDTDAKYYKNFYRVSLMYDGYQESVLAYSLYFSSTNPSRYGHQIKITANPSSLSKRLSHINIYRGKAYNANAVDSDFNYNLVESVAFQSVGWKSSSTAGMLEYIVKDHKGTNFGGYESLTGISPEMAINHLNYGLSEQCAGYLFVADANNSEINNVSNYIFRSKPGKYSIFNWATEYIVLQDKPKALKSYNNLLYAFSPSTIYTINPDNLSVIDKMEGMGCLDKDSIIATDFGMFFADKYGVYIHNGRKAEVISHAIHTSDHTDMANFTWDSISASLETNPPKLAFDGERKALLIIFEVSNVSYAWVYSVLSKRWDFWSFTNPITAVTQGKYGEAIASDGKLLQIATGTSRKPWEFHTKKITAGFDTYDKSFTEVHVEGNSGLETKYKTSGVSSLQSLSSNRVNSSHRKAKWLQLKISDSNGTRSLDSLGIHLRPIKARSTKV